MSSGNSTPESYDNMAAESRRLAEEAVHRETARLLISQAIDYKSKAAELRGEPPLAWSDAFSIGHDALDAEHRYLVEAINEIFAAFDADLPQPEIRSRLNALKVAITKHLRHESTVLERIKNGIYDDGQQRRPPPTFVKAMSAAAIEEHIAEHVDSLARVGALVADASHTSCLELKAWFVDHAIKHNSHLKSIFQAM